MSLPLAPQSRIALFGEALVDQFSTGPVAGGAPFNVARHLAALGQAPLLLTAVGDDGPAQAIRAELDRLAMRQDGLQCLAGVPTGVVDVATDGQGQHRFHIRGDCAYDHLGAAAVSAIAHGLAPGGWLYFGSMGQRAATSRQTWQAVLAAHPGPRYMDLNWRHGQVEPAMAQAAMAQADVLKLNDDELAMVLDWLGLAQAAGVALGSHPWPNNWQVGVADAALAQLMQRYALRHLVVTCGAAGYAGFAQGGLCIARGAADRAIAVVDTVGAGDSFSAVVLTGLLQGWPWPLTLARANRLAAQVCEVRGAMPAQLSDHAHWSRDWGLPAPAQPAQTATTDQTAKL